MIMAIIFALLGLKSLWYGAIFAFQAVLPSEDFKDLRGMNAVIGIALIIFGAALVFYGGTWI